MIGYVIPPYLKNDLEYLFIGNAVTVAIVLLFAILLFKSNPSVSDEDRSSEPLKFKSKLSTEIYDKISQMLAQLTEFNYFLHYACYGVNVGIVNTVSSLLGKIFLRYFPDSSLSGWLGLALILSGLITTGITGPILDYSKKYRLTSLVSWSIPYYLRTIFSVRRK